MTEQTQQLLLQQIATGNQHAFHQLYHLFKDKVYNTAIGYLQNQEEAEEVTQDVFLSIFAKAATYKAAAKVSTWIYRITVNKALNQLEKRKRQPFTAEYQSQELTDFKHPGVLLENKEKATYLFSAILSLAPQQQTAFILTYVEGLPQQETAVIMKLSVKALESLLQRAKGNLKKKLITLKPEGKTKK